MSDKHYTAKAHDDFQEAIKQGRTEREAIEWIAHLYFVAVATVQRWFKG